ncbi:MAG: DNA translocase FtsK 4TM domain-containing protein [Acutalibacteraceae bacterium]|jgi:S-DNA-T family DNA segregation ATPase FtsK/SpoIIIE
MAAAKRKGSAAKSKTSPAQDNAAGRRQLLSVAWFAVAVFLLCVVFIKGENLWAGLHNIIFGIFGLTAYFYPFLLGFVAIMYAVDKINGSITAKITESGFLVMFVGAAIDIFSKHDNTLTFWQHLVSKYTLGIQLKSGGFLGALVGQPLYLAFGKTGAAITVILLIFVLLMIITGTTLVSLFRAVGRPVKNISEYAETTYQAQMEKENTEGKKRLKVIKGFNADIPVDDIPKVRKRALAELNPKQRKVVSTYYGEPVPESETVEPEGAEDKEQLDKALKTAVAEAEEKVDVTAEISDFTENLENQNSESGRYVFPPLNLLKQYDAGRGITTGAELTAEHLVDTLKSFGVETRIVNISRGPTVTRYELQPCAGVKISKITNLADDIALNLATAGVRIEAPIPNKAAVGIEVPNKTSDIVSVRGILDSPEFVSAKSRLTVALGRDIGGNVVVADIAKMPHGLIAGATGSGKSVCINSIIISILYKATPDEVKLLMIDPKVVELGVYNGIPHLLVPVVTEPRKAAGALGWAVNEMEERYKMFADRGVRDIAGYNRVVENLNDPEIKKLPQIVIIIDELADLMMTAPNEVEDSINRIAAKARAAGMHLIIATQRPSVDVVTGVIKANIPTRIAFAVSSQIDSRTILDMAGAEKLLGRGDMLFSPMGSNKPSRIQGCFVSDQEVEAVVNFIKNGKTANYDENVMVEIERQAAVEKKQKTGLAEDGPDEDPMLKEAIEVVVENGMASTSLLQRKLKLGYARAARIIDEMEQRGIVGPYEGSKPRKVLISKTELLEREAAGVE